LSAQVTITLNHVEEERFKACGSTVFSSRHRDDIAVEQSVSVALGCTAVDAVITSKRIGEPWDEYTVESVA